MYTRNSNQTFLKILVRRVTAPGNLLFRKNISVADKFVPTHVRAHIHKLLHSVYMQDTPVRTHTGYWAYTHRGHCSPHTYRVLSVHTYRLLQSAHIQATERIHTHRLLQSAHIQATERPHVQATAVRTHTGYWAYTNTGYCSPHTYRLLPFINMCKASIRRTQPGLCLLTFNIHRNDVRPFDGVCGCKSRGHTKTLHLNPAYIINWCLLSLQEHGVGVVCLKNKYKNVKVQWHIARQRRP